MRSHEPTRCARLERCLSDRPTVPFPVIPEVSSEQREYASIGWLDPPVIPSNKLRLLANAGLADSGLLTSAMHMAWTRYIAGRLKSVVGSMSRTRQSLALAQIGLAVLEIEVAF